MGKAQSQYLINLEIFYNINSYWLILYLVLIELDRGYISGKMSILLDFLSARFSKLVKPIAGSLIGYLPHDYVKIKFSECHEVKSVGNR